MSLLSVISFIVSVLMVWFCFLLLFARLSTAVSSILTLTSSVFSLFESSIEKVSNGLNVS